MRRYTPATSDRALAASCGRSLLEWRDCLRGASRIGIALGLLVCLVLNGFGGSGPGVPRKLVVQRSMRAIPRRFAIRPNGASIAVNQTQRFEVTDTQGNPVAVRWNVSGLGCSGASCGTIDDDGVYRTPSSLPQPQVITLEGVLVSDPNYSVLTEVRLVSYADASPAPVNPPTAQV